MKEPCGFYLGFDNAFFVSSADKGHAAREAALAYRELLQRERRSIDRSLGTAEVAFRLPDKVCVGIEKLVMHEARHDFSLKKLSSAPAQLYPLLANPHLLFEAAGIQGARPLAGVFCERIISHLARLLLPAIYAGNDHEGAIPDESLEGISNATCERFGRDFVSYWTHQAVGEVAQRANQVVGTGGGVTEYWTLAPYVHRSLLDRGIGAQESMRAIDAWACSAFGNGEVVHPQIKALPVKPHCYELGLDERMPTHLYARLKALRVASSLARH